MKKQIQGFSLLEALIAMVVFDVIVLIGSGSMYFSYSQISRQNFAAGVDRLALALTEAAGSPASIRASVVPDSLGNATDADNQAIVECMGGGPGGGCDGTATWYPFRLYPQYYKVNATTVLLGGPIAGPGPAGNLAKAIRYSPEGAACNPLTDTCDISRYPIAVNAEFRGICAPIWEGYDFPQGAYVYQAGVAELWNAPLPVTAPFWNYPASASSASPSPSGAGLPFPGPQGLVGDTSFYPPLAMRNFSPGSIFPPGPAPAMSPTIMPASAVFPAAIGQPDHCWSASEFQVRLTFQSLNPTSGPYAGQAFPTFATTSILAATYVTGGGGFRY
jgi:hypothetical protein